MDRPNVVFGCGGVAFGDKKECSTDARYAVDELGRHYAQ